MDSNLADALNLMMLLPKTLTYSLYILDPYLGYHNVQYAHYHSNLMQSTRTSQNPVLSQPLL